MCKNCIHYEICCNEGRDDEALTFCANFFDLVRCKDCIHRRKFNKTKYYCEKTYADLSGWHKRVDDDFFCADGERKETE